MVRQVHFVFRVLQREIGGSLDVAGEIAVGGRKGGFPNWAEFIEDVGDLGFVGLVIQEYHHPLGHDDHFAQGRPVGQ